MLMTVMSCWYDNITRPTHWHWLTEYCLLNLFVSLWYRDLNQEHTTLPFHIWWMSRLLLSSVSLPSRICSFPADEVPNSNTSIGLGLCILLTRWKTRFYRSRPPEVSMECLRAHAPRDSFGAIWCIVVAWLTSRPSGSPLGLRACSSLNRGLGRSPENV